MSITEITVVAARTFNHPHEQYSNLRPAVRLHATIALGDDPDACIRQLQTRAEGLVEDHKQSMLRSLEELYQMNERQAEVRGLQRELQKAQDRLNDLRQKFPDLQLTNGPAEPDPADHPPSA